MEDLKILRIVENDIKGKICETQLAAGISNDAMCLILREIIGDYERARSTDYLLEPLREKKKEQEEKEAKDGNN